MGTCDETGCTGHSHFGKFGSCHIEALYGLSLNADDSTGDVDFNGHYSLVIVGEPETVTIDTDGRQVIVPTGNYLVMEGNTGMVMVAEFDSEQKAREVFDLHDTAYGEWVDQD